LVTETKTYTYVPSVSVKEVGYKELRAAPKIEMTVPVLSNPEKLEVGVRLSGTCGNYPTQAVEVAVD